MRNSLYGILDDLKTNAIPFVTGGAGVVAGLTAGKIAHDLVADWLAPLTMAGPAGADGKPTIVADTNFTANSKSALRLYVAPLVPIALGIATVVYGRGKVPAMLENAVEGAGLGLAAWGVGKLFTNVTRKDDGSQPEWVQKYVPRFEGVGEIRGLAAMYLRRAQLQGCGRGCAPQPALPAYTDTGTIPKPMQGVRGYRNSAPATRRSIGAAQV